jgi:uncharacterized protein YjaG (DUF416 family)
MMPFDRKNLGRELQKLSAKHRLAFAASCCNRVLPSYAAFSGQAGWGDYDGLMGAANYIWDVLEGELRSPKRLDALLRESEEAIPDLDEFADELATWGHDAALTVFHAIRCARNGSAEDAAFAGSWCHATVDAFVQDKGDMDPADSRLEQRISASPLMHRELKQQETDLEFLRHHPELTTAEVMQLRHSWQNHGRSNVDLP